MVLFTFSVMVIGLTWPLFLWLRWRQELLRRYPKVLGEKMTVPVKATGWAHGLAWLLAGACVWGGGLPPWAALPLLILGVCVLAIEEKGTPFLFRLIDAEAARRRTEIAAQRTKEAAAEELAAADLLASTPIPPEQRVLFTHPALPPPPSQG
jgi:hypothetical protein